MVLRQMYLDTYAFRDQIQYKDRGIPELDRDVVVFIHRSNTPATTV